MGKNRFSKVSRRQLMVVMGPAERFRDNFIDQTQLFQIVGGELQRLGRLRGVTSVLPQNRGTAFRADNRIIRVFQHENTIGNSDAERAAGASFADHGCNNWGPQDHHFAQINSNGLRNMPLLRAYARVGARRIDERNHRQMKLFCKPHQSKGFSVSLGVGATEIPPNIFFGIPTLLMGYNHTPNFADRSETAGHCLIVAKKAVAMKLQIVGKRGPEVVKSKRASGMSGDLNPLPGGELIINFALGFFDFLLHRLYFPIDVNRVRFRVFLQFFELLFQLNNWFLKFQRWYLHFTMTGVSFATRANSSSISGAASIIPLAGFGALGDCGFVSE